MKKHFLNKKSTLCNTTIRHSLYENFIRYIYIFVNQLLSKILNININIHQCHIVILSYCIIKSTMDGRLQIRHG
jgi:hypothetical protein